MIDRAAIHRGEILTSPASAESIALATVAQDHATRAFGCSREELRTLHTRKGADELWTQTCDARASLAVDPNAREVAIALAVALGFSRARLAVDAPRLRVVLPRMHESAAASRAFYTHRDTWYGSPRAQLNVWVPLFDVTELDSMAIYEKAFGASVDNDSRAFDYARVGARGGFPTFPRCLVEPPGDPVRVRARANEIVVFSAAHLHATTPNETRFTRVSVDVRFVDMDDVARDLGAPDVDNASRGSALVDYFKAGA